MRLTIEVDVEVGSNSSALLPSMALALGAAVVDAYEGDRPTTGGPRVEFVGAVWSYRGLDEHD